jgi:hypothetical protein
MQARSLVAALCVLLALAVAATHVRAAPGVPVYPEAGFVVSVGTNSSNGGAAHLLLWNSATGELLPSVAPIKPWWPATKANEGVTVDADASFGDWFLHEDGIVYFMLFASNTARPRSQQMQQYSVYDTVTGWRAPVQTGACMITPESSVGYPAMSSMRFIASLGSFVGFTDFDLQSPSVRNNKSSILGLASVWWNQPTCFQYPLLTYAKGLPLPFPHAAASTIHQASNTLSFVASLKDPVKGASSVEATEEPSVRMVVLDISSPLRATPVPVSSSGNSLPLCAFNATEADFRPALVPIEPLASSAPDAAQKQRSGGPELANYIVVQSRSSSPPSTAGDNADSAPPAVMSFDVKNGFHAPEAADGSPAPPMPFFPQGAAAPLVGLDDEGRPVAPLMVGVARQQQSGSDDASTSLFAAAPLTAESWSSQSFLLPADWSLAGQQLAFIPESTVAAYEAERIRGSSDSAAKKRQQQRRKHAHAPRHAATPFPRMPAALEQQLRLVAEQ